MDKSTLANIVIDRLGGTSKVAVICDVSDSCVSGWRQKGIPTARLQLLQEKHPAAFEGLAEHLPKKRYAERNTRRGRPPRLQGAMA